MNETPRQFYEKNTNKTLSSGCVKNICFSCGENIGFVNYNNKKNNNKYSNNQYPHVYAISCGILNYFTSDSEYLSFEVPHLDNDQYIKKHYIILFCPECFEGLAGEYFMEENQ